MSTKTLDRAQVSYFRTALDGGREVKKHDSGGGIIYGLPIFRAGSFKDSWGDSHTWEAEHLQQMVFHYNMLRERDVLPNVPVRDQHRSLFGGGGTVVGYIEGLRVEGEDAKGNPLLVADLDITEPDAFDKIDRGTWRSRSAEVGFYETNDEVMYWPVLMGLAWVDLPAVEGLFSKTPTSEDQETSYTPIHDEEEGAVSHAKNHNQGGGTPPDPSAGKPEGQGQGAPSPGSTSSEPGDEAKPKESEHGKDKQGSGEGSGQSSGDGSGDHGQADPATAGAAVSTHDSQSQPFEFTLNGGTKTTDFAAVQTHISNLESVLQEGREQARKDFVSSLAESNRIAATQLEEMQAHALSLTDEQYESFVKMWGNAPSAPLFDHHGQGDVTEPAEGAASEIEVLRERVKMHGRSGLSEEKVKETTSYKRLMELTDNKG